MKAVDRRMTCRGQATLSCSNFLPNARDGLMSTAAPQYVVGDMSTRFALKLKQERRCSIKNCSSSLSFLLQSNRNSGSSKPVRLEAPSKPRCSVDSQLNERQKRVTNIAYFC